MHYLIPFRPELVHRVQPGPSVTRAGVRMTVVAPQESLKLTYAGTMIMSKIVINLRWGDDYEQDCDSPSLFCFSPTHFGQVDVEVNLLC